jgi:hypothetical protein
MPSTVAWSQAAVRRQQGLQHGFQQCLAFGCFDHAVEAGRALGVAAAAAMLFDAQH